MAVFKFFRISSLYFFLLNCFAVTSLSDQMHSHSGHLCQLFSTKKQQVLVELFLCVLTLLDVIRIKI